MSTKSTTPTTPRRPPFDPNARGNPGDVEIPNRVFVKGFPKDAVEEDLVTYFKSFGIVRDTKVVRDKSLVSKGYGFVTFDSQGVAENVRAMGSVKYEDIDMVIGPAKIRKKRAIFRYGRPDQSGFWPGAYGQAPYGNGGYCMTTPDGMWSFQMNAMQGGGMAVPTHYSTVPVAGGPAPMSTIPYQHIEYQTVPQQYQQVPVYSMTPQQGPVAMTPQQVPVTIIQPGQPQIYTPTQTSPTQMNNNANQSPTFPIGVNNVAVGEYIKLSSKKSPTMEAVEYQQYTTPDQSPVQCVPIYENVHDDSIYQGDNLEAPNVLYVDTSKMKTVVVKRDVANKHGAYLPNNNTMHQHVM